MLTSIFRRLPDGTEYRFRMESSAPLSEGERERVMWLVSDLSAPEETSWTSFLADVPEASLVEIGPRLSVETPFSSNARMGLTEVARIERSHRFPISSAAERAEIIRVHLDPMIQQVYTAEITTLCPDVTPEPVQIVEILGEGGAERFEEANKRLGLGMDAEDRAFYVAYFAAMGRNPTDVELFQIANGISEHCRHRLFKGEITIDGVEMPKSLFEMVQEPLTAIPARENISLIAFRDNAGVMNGSFVDALIPERPGTPSPFIVQSGAWCTAVTAETHNHPTQKSPYQGAATGSGGKLRDEQAVGRGARARAGFAGYCVASPFLEGYPLPGHPHVMETIPGSATPLRILIDGSNGISDYQNQFGEPVIAGFCRTVDLVVKGTRWAFLKPVLYAGGTSDMQYVRNRTEKAIPEPGMCVVQIGGPAYRIGVGGGSASSMMPGENTEALDLASVQRGNAAMANMVARVIRTCIEMGENNPLLSIHDQGAGGPSNVLTELVDPAGGRFYIRRIFVGDPSMSVLELWSAEYQERFGMLVSREGLRILQEICAREGVPCEVVGEVTGDGYVTLVDSRDNSTPVHLNLEGILTGLPEKAFRFNRVPCKLFPLVLPDGLSLPELTQRVLKLPSVGSKAFLVHKADRSVGGRVARQQCCGPMQLPVADVAVTATSFFRNGAFGTHGTAQALGEQPLKMLVNPAAGARMTVGEMLTNLAAAKGIKIGHVRCRANWMWPVKAPGEGACLYDAVRAMRDVMIALGIAPDGGKDSFSMLVKILETLIKSPRQLVILGSMEIQDVERVMTPDLKRPGKTGIGLIDLGGGKNRLGGSALAQSYGQIGDESPDMDDPALFKRAFLVVQTLIEEQKICALHDRSDGGLITTLIEMCLAGNGGMDLDVGEQQDLVAMLFSEELGWALEFSLDQEEAIAALCRKNGVPFRVLGKTIKEPTMRICRSRSHWPVFQESLPTLRSWWEATSLRLDQEQANPETVEMERQSHASTVAPTYALSFTPMMTTRDEMLKGDAPRVAILRDRGTNGDTEMAAACVYAGLRPYDITMRDLCEGSASLDDFQGVVFPGGFSYMDVFESAKVWAGIIRFNPLLRDMFERFYHRPDTFSLGVCNGCQLMALLGWVPWRGVPDREQPRFVRNTSQRFESRWSRVLVQKSPSILLQGMAGSVLGVWVAHGEGRLVCPNPSLLQRIQDEQLAPLAYVDPVGISTETYPYNPNGSPNGITALCSPDGRHLAMMPHAERCFLPLQLSYMPPAWERHGAAPWLRLFQNAREWCLEQSAPSPLRAPRA
ncbi:MAG: hypothetical protein RL141_610 [Candidatus Parcubacteria bacterium]